MRSRFLQPNQAERGQTMALVAISLVSLLAMAALAIDVVTLYVARGQVERAADAAAIAAAKVLADTGVTTDPSNSAGNWNRACIAATNQATWVAAKNLVAGQTPSVTVTFPNAPSSDCKGACTGTCSFGMNPQVTVSLTVSGLPTFFSRIWSRATNTAGASARAEVYNPNSFTNPVNASTTLPIAPRCVKPLLLPNCDPQFSSNCTNSVTTFVTTSTGTITKPGFAGSGGVIGEQFSLTSNCTGASGCTPGTPALNTYYPITLPAGGYLCPNRCSPSAGFEQDLACCNFGSLQCGGQVTVDTTDSDPGSSGTAAYAGQCLIHGSGQSYLPDCGSATDQDCIRTSGVYPFVMEAGGDNPLKNASPNKVNAGDPITTSDSVVSLPIYDSSGGAPQSPGYKATIIGFLQVFVNDVANNGRFTVTVLNVTGCGSSLASTPIYGAGPTLPVRLIHN